MDKRGKQEFIFGKYAVVMVGFLVWAGLYLASLYNYLLFHELAEIFSVVVAYGIFVFAWNSRRLINNTYLLFIGCAYLFVGLLDLVHTLGYKGMNIFQGYDTNLPTQLWIAARYMQSLSLLIAPLLVGKKLNIARLLSVYMVVVVLLLAMIFGGVFPVCFREGAGLTPFKKFSEYIISLILVGALVLLRRKRREFDAGVLRLLMASIIFTIGSELAFTFYRDAYAFFNLTGHYLKIVAFYLIYKAIIEMGLKKPFRLLFRDLKQREEALKAALKEKEVLLKEVCHRTKNNMASICSILKLESALIEDEKFLKILQDIETRISSMALVQEKLYRSEDMANIDLREYVEELAYEVLKNYQTIPPKVLLKFDVEPVTVSTNTAIPCALILSELLSNAMKYAFPGNRRGEITVILHTAGEGDIELGVSDNGVGLGNGFDFRNSESLGLKLVIMLAEGQLRGRIDCNRDNDRGTGFIIRFKERKQKQ